jgi:nucleoside-diphosphate-sugar epimerase
MRIGITGATGGVGRAVCRAARALGNDVVALVRDPERAKDLAALGVTLVRGDLEDAGALESIARGADAVVHGAAHVGDVGTPAEFERVNVGGTERVVEATARAGAKRFVHVSSTAVYGRPPNGVIDETRPPRPFGKPYEDTKLAAERLAFERGKAKGLEVAAVRPCIIFGAEDRVFLPRAIKTLRARRALYVNGGRGRLNVIAAEDVADVILRCAAQPGAVGEAFNVASDPVPTVREVLETIADAAGAPRPTRSLPYPAAMAVAIAVDATWRIARLEPPPPITPFVVTLMTRDVVYDSSKARRVLGWTGGRDALGAIRRAVARIA